MKCPFCESEIKDDALKCKYCKEFLPKKGDKIEPSNKKSIRKCPKCKGEVPKNASKCMHCGSDLRGWFRRHPIISLILFVFLFGAIVGGLGEEYNVSSPTTVRQTKPATREVTDQQAYVISQNFVEQRLKAPSTAKFPLGVYEATKDSEGNFVIKSYVDSQNAFGAMIRTTYLVTIKHKGGDWANPNNWELISILME